MPTARGFGLVGHSKHPKYAGGPARTRRGDEQLFADGGLVKRARGFFSNRTRDIDRAVGETDRLRALAPQMEAMGFKQRQPTGQTDRLRALAPKMAAMGYPQRFADGGEVKKQKPLAQGFDMETARMLNEQPDSVPAMMKPGEYVLPPDTVAAVGGPQALDGLVDETHTQGNTDAIVPKGFEPEFFFATGGLVDDKKKRPGLNRESAMAQLDAIEGISPQQRSAMDADAQRQRAAETTFDRIADSEVTRQALNTLGALPGVGGALQGAAGLAGASRGVQAAGGAMSALAGPLKAVAPYAPPYAGYVAIRSGENKDAATRQPLAQVKNAPSAPIGTQLPGDANMPAQDVAARGFGGGARVAGAGVAGAATNDIQKTVGPDGRVTYSGQNIGPGATINGATPGGGYMEVPGGTGGGFGSPAGFTVPGLGTFHDAENARMAANLRDGVDINRGANGPSVVTVGTSPEEARMQRQREQMMRHLAAPLTGDFRQDMTAAQRRGITDLLGMESGERREAARSAAGMEQERMRLDAGRERDTMADRRQAERIALDAQRLDGDERARGFTEREAMRRESILGRYDSAKDAAERAEIVQQHPEIFGQQDGSNLRNRFMLRNLGKDSMGNDLGQELVDLSRFNPESQQPRAKPIPSSKKALVVGELYETPQGPMTWDGKQFVR